MAKSSRNPRRAARRALMISNQRVSVSPTGRTDAPSGKDVTSLLGEKVEPLGAQSPLLPKTHLRSLSSSRSPPDQCTVTHYLPPVLSSAPADLITHISKPKSTLIFRTPQTYNLVSFLPLLPGRYRPLRCDAPAVPPLPAVHPGQGPAQVPAQPRAHPGEERPALSSVPSRLWRIPQFPPMSPTDQDVKFLFTKVRPPSSLLIPVTTNSLQTATTPLPASGGFPLHLVSLCDWHPSLARVGTLWVVFLIPLPAPGTVTCIEELLHVATSQRRTDSS